MPKYDVTKVNVGVDKALVAATNSSAIPAMSGLQKKLKNL
jgi:hypothetical protein